MSILLLALATALSAEVLLALQPGKCVRLISGAFFCVGVFLSILCILDTRIALLYAVVSLALCAWKFKWFKAIPSSVVVLVALLINLLPGAQELIYLNGRYADHFTYISDGVFHSAVLDCNVVVSLEDGDTYQTSLYSKQLISMCTSRLPASAEVLSAYVEKQQTPYLARSYEDYAMVMSPTVHIEVKFPERNQKQLEFPLPCILETLS